MEIRKASVYAIALVATLAILVGTLSGLDAVGLRQAKGTASLAESPPIHAIEHGSVTVSPDTHIETPALLRVTTNPPVPGKIIVDGVARDEWGLTWMKIASGDHTVTFSDLSGLAPPAAQTITAVSGQTSIVVGNYAIQGFLRVLTEGALDPTIYCIHYHLGVVYLKQGRLDAARHHLGAQVERAPRSQEARLAAALLEATDWTGASVAR